MSHQEPSQGRRYSHTQLSVYHECRHKYRAMYLQKWTPRKRPGYFILGEAVHKYIEMYYGTKDKNLAKKQVENVYGGVDTSLLSPDEIHNLEVDKSIAFGITDAYPEFYKQDFDEFNTFLTEQEFTIPLATGYNDTYYGKVDVLVKDAAGDWWILETKTAAANSINESYLDRVKIDSQVSGYMHGAKAILGSFPRGVIYNIIKKPAIRLKKGESSKAFAKRIYLEYAKMAEVKHYFTREQVIVGDKQLDRWLKNTTWTAGEITAALHLKRKVWPQNTGACTTKYGACQYMRACVDQNYSPLLYTKRQ